MKSATKLLNSLLEEISGAFLESVCLYPASIQMNFQKRAGDQMFKFVVCTNGFLSERSNVLSAEEASGSGVGLLYLAIDKPILGISRQGKNSYALRFAIGTIFAIDPDPESDHVLMVRAFDWPSVGEFQVLLFE